jgi:hypothetical protein
MPEKITPEQYRQSRANGWTDDDLRGMGYDIPSYGIKVAADRTDQTIRNPNATNPVVDVGVGAVQGASLGIADNLSTRFRDRLARARANSGALTTAGEIAGGLIPGAGIAKAGAKSGSALVRAATGNITAQTAPRRIAQSAAAGAGYGGLYGATETEDGSRLLGAAKGAGLGALGGALFSSALESPRAASAASRKVREWMGRTSPEEIAGRELSRPLAGDRTDLLKAAESADEGDIGVDLMGKQTLGRVRQAFGVGGEDVGDAQRVIEARMMDPSSSPKTRLAARAGVSPDESNRRAISGIAQEYKPQIAEQYKAFYDKTAGGIDTPGLDVFLGRVGPDGSPDPIVAKTFEAATNQLRRKYGDDPARFADGNPIVSGELVDVMKRFLDREYKLATRGAATIGAAQDIRERIDDLVLAVDDLNWNTARGLETEKRALQEASVLGGKTVKSGSGDVRDVRELDLPKILNKRGVSDKARARGQEEFQRGAARQILNLDDEEIWKLASSERGWRRLMQSVPESEAEAFQAELLGRWAKVSKERAVMGAPVTHNGADLSNPDVFGRLTPWAVASALRGSPMLAVAQGIGTAGAVKMRGNEVRANEILAKLSAMPVRAGGKVNPEFAKLVRQLTGTTKPDPETVNRLVALVQKHRAPITRAIGQGAGR